MEHDVAQTSMVTAGGVLTRSGFERSKLCFMAAFDSL